MGPSLGLLRGFAAAFHGLMVLGACTPTIEPGITADCSGGQLVDELVMSSRNRKTALFVIDDSLALSARATEVADALRATVQRWVNPTCEDERPNRDPFVRCRRTFRYGDSSSQPQDNEVDFAFVLATRPDGSDECEAAFAAHGGQLLNTANAPDGFFEWRPSEFADLAEAPARLDALLAEVDQVAAHVSKLMTASRCESPQPLETLAQLLVVATDDPALQAQRERLTSQHLSLVVLSGSDDRSLDALSNLLPVERYLNAFNAERLCTDSATFDPDACPEPHVNPLCHPESPTLVTFELVGPDGVAESCGSTEEASGDAPYSSASAPKTRLEEVGSTLPVSRAAPWCFESIATPEAPNFMRPIFHSSAPDHPNVDCSPSVALDTDVESSTYGRANCRVFERSEASGPCECQAPARQLVSDEVLRSPSVVRFLEEHGADANCVCELMQLTDAELVECQTRHYTSVIDEPQGWCFVDPAKGVGVGELVETCPVTMKSRLRWLGRDVPAPDTWSLAVCSSQQCTADD